MSSSNFPHADDVQLTIKEAAELIRVEVNTMRWWKHQGKGPRSFKVGRWVRYWKSEVLAWLEEVSDPDHDPDDDRDNGGYR